MKLQTIIVFVILLFVTIKPTPVHAVAPIGTLDYANQYVASGWARDDDYSGPVFMHIYIDDVYKTGVQANLFRSDVGSHGFSWIPTGMVSGTHKINVYVLGVDSSGNLNGENKELMGSPTSIYVENLNTRSLTIGLPDSLANFPIHDPTIGSDAVACYTGSNQSREWEIYQGKNEQSLCLDTNNTPFDSECFGADFARETMTTRACYWKNRKKFHFTVNTNNFSENGCHANTGALGGEPGGYGLSLMSGISHRNDWISSYPNYILGNLDKLIVSLDFSIDYFNDQYPVCRTPCDPVAGTCSPIAFFGLNFMTHKFAGSSPQNWQGSQFYNVGLWDNRPPMSDPALEIVDCQLPTTSGAGTFVNSGQPITYYGLPMNSVGAGPKTYEIDVLPRLKHYISVCEQQLHNNSNPDFNSYMVDGAFFANEVYNTAVMSFDITNPQIKIVYKSDYIPEITGDLDSPTKDGDVDLYDFRFLLNSFTQQVNGDLNSDNNADILDYNILLRNFGQR